MTTRDALRPGTPENEVFDAQIDGLVDTGWEVQYGGSQASGEFEAHFLLPRHVMDVRPERLAPLLGIQTQAPSTHYETGADVEGTTVTVRGLYTQHCATTLAMMWNLTSGQLDPSVPGAEQAAVELREKVARAIASTLDVQGAELEDA